MARLIKQRSVISHNGQLNAVATTTLLFVIHKRPVPVSRDPFLHGRYSRYAGRMQGSQASTGEGDGSLAHVGDIVVADPHVFRAPTATHSLVHLEMRPSLNRSGVHGRAECCPCIYLLEHAVDGPAQPCVCTCASVV
jgi:hypothetical protein